MGRAPGLVVSLSDEAMLQLVRAALGRADPVPTELVEFARGASSWRTIDRDLAALDGDGADGVQRDDAAAPDEP